MNNLLLLVRRAERALHSNSPAILTAIGVSGTITTAVLAAQAGMKQAQDEDAPPSMSTREMVERHWKLYIPPMASGAITIVCVIAASKASARKTAAIGAAYSLTEKAFSDYKEKIVETIGEKKEQAVRDEIAQDKVNGADSKNVIVLGSGNVLCCELDTMRFFESSMEKLRKAQNDINAKMIRDDQASLSDFYYLIDLPYTTHSSDLGWTNHRMMELEFSVIMAPSGRPCIAFDYNYTRPLD